MRRSRGGFTIIEVMIFLAISGAMLVAAIAAINGQQNRTEFTQSMRDIDSKLQDTLNDVSTGNFNFNDQKCTIVGSGSNARPQFTGVTGQQIGSRSECLFLGEALQFNTSAGNNDKFYTYSVLGRRVMQGTIPTDTVSVSSFDEANPTAMIGGGQDLSSSYTFEQGITAKKIIYSSTTDQYALIGLYTNFNSATGIASNTSADAAQSLQAYTYKLAANTAFDTTGNPSAKYCIDNTNNPATPCSFDQSLGGLGSNNGLKICFLSNNGTSQTAMITIFNTAAGVNTRLDYNPDISVCPTS